jgi:hypothetical protein
MARPTLHSKHRNVVMIAIAVAVPNVGSGSTRESFQNHVLDPGFLALKGRYGSV